MTEEHLCVCCPQLRNGEPRIYDRPSVCDGCRARLRAMLAEVADLYTDLVESYTALVPETRTWEWQHLDRDGKVHKITHHDPLSCLPAGTTRAAGGAPVSGSRNPPLPVGAGTLDATLPPRGPGVSDDLVPLYERRETTVEVYDRTMPTRRCECSTCEQARRLARKQGEADPTEPYIAAVDAPLVEVTLSQRQRKRDANGWLAYGPSGDQVGDVSAPAVLDSWARDWQTYDWALLPPPSVDSLAAWLADRLETACDRHSAIDDFAWELDDLVRRLRPTAPRAELKVGVPCRECEEVTLFRWPGSDYIECGNCPCLMSPDEYERWTQLITATEHQPWVRALLAAQRDAAAS